jgi:acetoin utilization deacetylase AcuC-like enzyme
MEELVLFYPKGHEKHYEVGHPERPDRVEAIRQYFEREKIWESAKFVDPLNIPNVVLENIHDPSYLNRIEQACLRGQRIDMDTYITPDSWELALNAAGGACAVAKEVWQQESAKGFALCRPPGHHATPNRAMGFCIINNIAVAAEYLIQIEGSKKIAIIDIDLHHGNGTQDIFWQREDVFFFSIHQYPLYPLSGLIDETGSGEGVMKTLNIPLPPNSGDNARQRSINEIILPLLDKFSPEMILVSIGFDAHWRDPLGQQLTSANGYGETISKLVDWSNANCDGRLATFLEGGYDLEAGATSAVCAAKAMIGQEWGDPLGASPYPEDPSWEKVVNNIKETWNL